MDPGTTHSIYNCGRRLIERRDEWLLYPSAAAKAVGKARPDEREIDIPGAERTAVTDFGARAVPMTTVPACRRPPLAAKSARRAQSSGGCRSMRSERFVGEDR
jgi:hypothetical protein